MSDREPPYPADARAKGWRFELDLERVVQSDTWALAKPQIRPWLFMLWTTAWQQTPCGSLPADDELIIVRLGIEPELFNQHKEHLMRGWWKASDGRLYHQTITQLVLQMLEKKESERTRKAAYRTRVGASKAGAPSDLSHGTDAGKTWESGGIDNTRTITRTSSIGGEPPITPSADAPTGEGATGESGKKAADSPEVGQATTPKAAPKKPAGGAMAGLELPDWMPLEDWDNFVEMRRKMGKSIPFTLASAQGNVRELGKLRDQGQDPAAVLQQSVNLGYRGVFPLKGQFQPRVAVRELRYAAAGRSLYGGSAAGAGEVFDA